MSGLIYKEICMFKSQFKSWILALAILCVYCFFLKSMSILLMTTVFMGVISCLTTFSLDKTYRCDEYVAAMPLSRRKIVVSKYVFLMLLDVTLTVLTGIAVAVVSPFFNESLWDMAKLALLALGVTMFLQALVLPLIYKLGPEKARFAFVVMGITPYMVLMMFKNRFVEINLPRLLELVWVLPIVLVVVIGVSMWISVRIYGKKDL